MEANCCDHTLRHTPFVVGMMLNYRARAAPQTGEDSNMRSDWLRSRNDVIANFALLPAALGVFGTGPGWRDVIVASIVNEAQA
jgi:hypothetical protein